MNLRMRDSPSSTKLNSVQQAAHNLLKQNTLKIGDFWKELQSALGAGAPPPGASLDFNNLENLPC